MGQMTILAGPERRRRWSDEERLRILAEAFSPGASVAEVARRHDVSRGLIYQWRRDGRQLAEAGFSPAVVIDDGPELVPSSGPAIVIELPRGGRVSISATTSPALAAAVLKALR